MNTLIFHRKSLPNDLGYHDELTVLNDHGSPLIVPFPCRTWPNPFRPSDNTPYYAAYGAIEIGDYLGRCVENDEYGKCVLINNALAVPSVWPNINHQWEPILTQAFIHCGGLKSQNPEWPGSAGCLTIPQPQYNTIMGLLEYNEEMKIIIGGPKLQIGIIPLTGGVV